MQRPDLSDLPAEVLAYIELLEAQSVARADGDDGHAARGEPVIIPNEPPTTVNLITVSAGGYAKRTPRHFYGRQRRGGMGIFDLDSPDGDYPAHLVLADESANLMLVTTQARIFRLAVNDLPEREIRARGENLLERVTLRPEEKLAFLVADPPVQGGSFLVLVTERGQVRRIGRQYLGASLQPGSMIYDVREGGAPAAYCWSNGNDELFIVTQTGQAIRFGERLVPVRGCLGLRVDPGDKVTGVSATSADGGVFLLSSDGKGTIRQLSGFGANKAPGAGGKVAMKADAVVGAVAVPASGSPVDLFAISRLGKIIRFQAAEVPPKEGVVQGVNCMNLRADECAALTGCAVAG
jgi:DNA gyrase subunit A